MPSDADQTNELVSDKSVTDTADDWRAERAYRRAFGRALDNTQNLTTTYHAASDDMILVLQAAIPSDLLDDSTKLLALERTIHEEVRREDESLVGRIAISYEAAS